MNDSYGVKDPFWYETKTLADTRPGGNVRNYNNTYKGLRMYGPGDNSIAHNLTFKLASPAELIITDPLGRKLCIDPRTGQEYSEITTGSYFHDSIGDPDLPAPQNLHTMKTAYILEPIEGDYTVEVIGTGNDSYSFGVWGLGGAGEFIKSDTRNITTDEVVQYKISLDNSSGLAV